MKVLFPCHPLKPRLPDPDYEAEANAAREAGFQCEFYDLELLREGDAVRACASLRPSEAESPGIVHRGWMMPDALYAALYAELVRKRYSPVTNPKQYAEAHYLPNAYSHLTGLTPESAWIDGSDITDAWEMYQRFSTGPALVKDFVKSAKHRWHDACFIPAHTTRERFEEIMRAFLQARGSQFNKGIVMRRYHELLELERDAQGQPVHEEYRMFFWNGELLAATSPLHSKGPFEEMDKWGTVARRFSNQFISMDVAHQVDNSWIIIEVGDGGVSGLPDSIDPHQFYSELWKRCGR